MLRTYVHNIILVGEYCVLLCLSYRAVGQKLVLRSGIGKRFVGHVLRVERIFLLGLVVLAHGVAYPVFAQEYAAHVGMSGKLDSVKVEHLALVYVGNVPKVACRRQHRVNPVGCRAAQVCTFARGRGLQHVDNAESAFLTPVHTYEVLEEVHVFFIAQAQKLGLQKRWFNCSYIECHALSSLGRFCLRLVVPKKFSIFTMRCSCIIP